MRIFFGGVVYSHNSYIICITPIQKILWWIPINNFPLWYKVYFVYFKTHKNTNIKRLQSLNFIHCLFKINGLNPENRLLEGANETQRSYFTIFVGK